MHIPESADSLTDYDLLGEELCALDALSELALGSGKLDVELSVSPENLSALLAVVTKSLRLKLAIFDAAFLDGRPSLQADRADVVWPRLMKASKAES
ncbi:MAG: hypothetical protein KAV00_13350 [Phycisphaerae bacterium]|nr:hypothetical protein [Phycisphaerae bacterium]